MGYFDEMDKAIADFFAAADRFIEEAKAKQADAAKITEDGDHA